MPDAPIYRVTGFPADLSSDDKSLARGGLMDVMDVLVRATTERDFAITIQAGRGARTQERRPAADPNHALTPSPARHAWGQLVLDPETMQSLVDALDWIDVQDLVYQTWGFSGVDPHPRTALNFHGPPGTGKTLAAHCAAHRLDRYLICASYAELESKFHGEGPKNVEALFGRAEAEDAVVFIDEADSLLSRRLSNADTGTEQAINSMRSQLLICLEKFTGIVIFATNLVENYDPAFHGRVRHVRFGLPQLEQRKRLWQVHLPEPLPTAQISIDRLAEVDGVSGRDIRNAALEAAQGLALRVLRGEVAIAEARLTEAALLAALERLLSRRIA